MIGDPIATCTGCGKQWRVSQLPNRTNVLKAPGLYPDWYLSGGQEWDPPILMHRCDPNDPGVVSYLVCDE